MRKISLLLMLWMVVLFSRSACAQALGGDDAAKSELGSALTGSDSAGAPGEQGRLFSPSVARKLHEMAYELAQSKSAGGAEIQQGIVLSKAAMELDGGADYARPTLIELACRDQWADNSDLVRGLLVEYVDESADLEVAGKAVRYLLEKANSREEREEILRELGNKVSSKNLVFGTELITLLGMLVAEKPDVELAVKYLGQAYMNNKYNKVAFAKLAELLPDKLGPEHYLEHLRLALREDPSNIEAALRLGEYAEWLELYNTAADAYQYCADLFNYLYLSEPLPARIYIPWAISSYNTEGNQRKCLQIADSVRQSGRFDLRLEALAGKAATKLGDGEKATEIFQAAEAKARQLLMRGPRANKAEPEGAINGGSQQVTAKQFAWFYCFALPNPEKALDWANKAYASEPNSPSAAGILAYALMLNGQSEWAKPLIENNQPSQISDLVQAQIQIAEGKEDSAVDTLRLVIAKDPGSLAAEQARSLLARQGGEYIAPIDPDIVLNMLEQVLGQAALVPSFTPPERMISVQFNIRGNEFPYGSEFGAVVAVMNNSSESLVVSDDGLFKGNLRVDAEVSGDLSVSISELVSVKVRTDFLIEPGQSILIPMKLVTGKLRRMLLTFPQASLDIEFTLYIDPVVTAAGQASNRLSRLEPTKLLVKRPGIEISSKYLRNRFNLISKGHHGQKIKTSQLFIGLLMEQYAMSNRKPPYRFVYADWMPTMFRNALVHESGLLRNPANGEWVVKVHTMAEMLYLPMDDHELVGAVSENLNNSNWPVRMLAIYLLAKTQDGRFDKVLEWAARYDPDKLVREMAGALAATGPKAPGPENTPAPGEADQPLPIVDKQ